ncbi:MAG: lysine--tRNA ligase [Candidatus Omnitrophota bacterium]
MEINEIIQERINKLKTLSQKGINPYVNSFAPTASIGEVLNNFQEQKKVSLAGRITAKRLHGKAAFLDLKDQTGKIQAYVKEDFVGKEGYEIFGQLDLGDIVGLTGELFTTHTKEPTIKTQDLVLLTKALRPLPEKWHGLKDVETRYRQRYLDLITNEEVKSVFVKRSLIISKIREILDKKGFLEVETPMMQEIPGGAAGRPFKTHHNEYDIDLFLRIAPELYLKKLLVGGFQKVYEINRNFRNEGVSTRHNPEFTMLELYVAYSDCQGMMRLCQDLISQVAKDVLGTTKINYLDKEINLEPPWQVISFAQAVEDKFSIKPSDSSEEMLEKLHKKGRALGEKKLSRSQVVKMVEDILQENASFSPTFFVDYFTILCPLAKKKQDNPLLSERFELFIGGMEVANAYSELNDPIEQRARLQEELAGGATDLKNIDEDFLLSLEQGMPPAGGLGIGIDRLIMILTNQASIRDVILFPQLKPIKND